MRFTIKEEFLKKGYFPLFFILFHFSLTLKDIFNIFHKRFISVYESVFICMTCLVNVLIIFHILLLLFFSFINKKLPQL